jgi:hypothetical protein
MSGMMNGAPYYSAPHRHQKSYMTRLGSLAEETIKPELAELPALVASAIRRGLIKRPDPSGLVPVPVVKRGPLAPWMTADCDECGISFERHKRTLTKCQVCRIPIKPCKNCGTEFRPADLKKVCCSAECSRLIQVASFRAQHTYTKSLPKMAECIVCHQVRPVRPAGSGVAKTCSPECSKQFRAARNYRSKTSETATPKKTK